MTLLGDMLRRISQSAAELGQAVVDGVTDATESLTGKNAVTKAARNIGGACVHGARKVVDSAIDLGEAILNPFSEKDEA